MDSGCSSSQHERPCVGVVSQVHASWPSSSETGDHYSSHRSDRYSNRNSGGYGRSGNDRYNNHKSEGYSRPENDRYSGRSCDGFRRPENERYSDGYRRPENDQHNGRSSGSYRRSENDRYSGHSSDGYRRPANDRHSDGYGSSYNNDRNRYGDHYSDRSYPMQSAAQPVKRPLEPPSDSEARRRTCLLVMFYHGQLLLDEPEDCVFEGKMARLGDVIELEYEEAAIPGFESCLGRITRYRVIEPSIDHYPNLRPQLRALKRTLRQALRDEGGFDGIKVTCKLEYSHKERDSGVCVFRNEHLGFVYDERRKMEFHECPGEWLCCVTPKGIPEKPMAPPYWEVLYLHSPPTAMLDGPFSGFVFFPMPTRLDAKLKYTELWDIRTKRLFLIEGEVASGLGWNRIGCWVQYWMDKEFGCVSRIHKDPAVGSIVKHDKNNMALAHLECTWDGTITDGIRVLENALVGPVLDETGVAEHPPQHTPLQMWCRLRVAYMRPRRDHVTFDEDGAEAGPFEPEELSQESGEPPSEWVAEDTLLPEELLDIQTPKTPSPQSFRTAKSRNSDEKQPRPLNTASPQDSAAVQSASRSSQAYSFPNFHPNNIRDVPEQKIGTNAPSKDLQMAATSFTGRQQQRFMTPLPPTVIQQQQQRRVTPSPSPDELYELRNISRELLADNEIRKLVSQRVPSPYRELLRLINSPIPF